MEKEVRQLVEMGATTAQARAALKKYKDVMRAAERIFEGEFEDVMDDADDLSTVPGRSALATESRPRMITPHDDEDSGDDHDHDMDEEGEEDDDGDDYVDYDSDYDAKAEAGRAPAVNVDPYAGIFFSKDRREEVIEVEEEPEVVTLQGHPEAVKLMTQGQWMKGCPEGGEQGFLFGLYSRLTEGVCICPHGCQTSVLRKKSDFFALFPSFSTYISHLSTLVSQTCPSCKKEFCFACGEPIAVERNQVVTGNLDNNPLFHCSDLQGIILGVGLSMLEQLFTEQVRDVDGTKRLSTKSKKRKAEPSNMPGAIDPDDEDELYYGAKGKKAKGGIGYAGNTREDLTGQMEALSIQKAKDEKIANLLKAVREYLPCIQRAGGGRTSDFLVHPTTLAHLRRRFNYVSSTLLRNDSLADMSDRSVLYFELFSWLETISNHEALASMMAMPIMVVSSIKAVSTKKSASKNQIRERTIIYEGSSGPRELLEAIVIQAQAALKGLEGNKPVEPETKEMTEEQKRMKVDEKGKGKEREEVIPDENAKLLDFCRRIMATAAAIDRSLHDTKGETFVTRLQASLPKVPSTIAEASEVQAPPEVGVTEEDTKRIYFDWATRVRFEYCDLTVNTFKPAGILELPGMDSGENKQDEAAMTPHYKFYFNNEARMLANSEIPKRALAIAKELAVLTTNLPVAWDSSIFLRVDESRVDIIKALITGPEGTPYYNGCYLFDIFLGPSYNQTPPSVKYMTTNGGKYRFNPNLYADGKVCLSLLGTWQGPGWIAGKSTLLQVLISIQSMILCEEPYLNEPGWANDSGTPQSKAYSANVRRMVVHTAMLGNLKNPPEPFEDVIKTHFRLKARSIMKQLDEWLALDDGKPTLGDGGGYSTAKTANAAGASSNGFQRDIEEMKKLLTNLQGEDASSAVVASGSGSGQLLD